MFLSSVFFFFVHIITLFVFFFFLLLISHLLSPLRHPPGHAYFDPNDFLEGMQQDIEREELEYEVKHQEPRFFRIYKSFTL